MTVISEVVKVPVAVSETGYILIVGDATGSPSGPNAPQSSRWDYLALSYDQVSQTRHGEAFQVSKAEMDGWTE